MHIGVDIGRTSSAAAGQNDTVLTARRTFSKGHFSLDVHVADGSEGHYLAKFLRVMGFQEASLAVRKG